MMVLANTDDKSLVQYDVFKAVQINVADGFPGGRLSLMTSWLKQKANDTMEMISSFSSVTVLYSFVFYIQY
mgnify:CR=1 FL=1